MGGGKIEPWVVEVRRADPADRLTDDWIWVSTCPDSRTALAVVDALRNLMHTNLVKSHLLEVRTRTAQVWVPGGGE